MSPVITLLTDFGLGDAYVASVKGVILGINPEAVIVDISHSIEPQNILQAAFVLSTAHQYFPDGTIHVVVVDPGVGSQRKVILLRTSSAYFLAPDNGVLSYVIDEICPAETVDYQDSTLFSPRPRNIKGYLEAIAITNSKFWRHPVSTTFHGRDIFAPTAAHLSLGISLDEFGEAVDSVYASARPKPYYDSNGYLVGYVVHIDNFGNLITNITDIDLPRREVSVELGGQSVHGVDNYYAESEGLVAILGSSDYLEISLSNGNAASFLGAKIGDKVRLLPKKDQK